MEKILRGIERLPNWSLALIIGLLAFLQYSNTFQNDYALDDTIVILENSKVKEGFVDLNEYFVKAKSQLLEDQYGYRPITLMTLALDIEMFGKGPYGGHVMNSLFYAALCILLFFTLKKLFPKARTFFLFAVVLLFVVHPLHVEAVANIKSRDEILALFFGLLSLNFFLSWLREGKIWAIPVSILALGLGLLSKESAVTFLAILPLAALVQLDLPWKKRLIRTSVVLVACLGIVVALTSLTQKSTVDRSEITEGVGIKMEDKIMGNAIFQQHKDHERFATGTGIMLRYVKSFLVPHPLVYYTGYNHIPLTNFGDPLVIGSLLFHALLIFLAIWYFRKYPVIAFGVAYYFITISPYTHFLRPLSDAMADRFMLSPSLGMSLLLVFGLMKLARIPWEKEKDAQEKTGKGKKKKAIATTSPFLAPFIVVMAGILVTYSVLSFQRNKAWEDNLVLFGTDIENLEECARCHFHYAEALALTFQTSPKQAQILPEIIHHYQRAIEITPLAYNSYISLGRFFYSLQRYEEGNQVLENAIVEYPEEARPYFHLAYGLMAQRREKDAIPHFEKTIELAPKREEAYFYYAWANYNIGNYDEGIRIMEEGLAKFPENSPTYHDALSDMCLGVGQLDKGFSYLRDALEAQPNNLAIYQKFIKAYTEIGDTTNASYYTEQAISKGLMR